MILIRTPLDPLRRSLFAALGLLAACVPGKGESDSDSVGQTDSASSTASTTNATASSTSGPTSQTATATESGGGTGTGTASSTDGGSSSVSGTGTSNLTTAATTGGPGPACEGTVTELMQGFVDPPTPSGFVQCDGGIVHRVDKVACLAPTTPSSCPPDASDMGECKTDADCNAKPFGSCQLTMVFGGVVELPTDTCGCIYGCQTDADCGADQVCRCAGDGLGLYTECVPASCFTDADCPGDEICGFSPNGSGCAPGVWDSHCTTPQDTCASDADCVSPPCMWNDQTMNWSCSNIACGRPFYVEDEAVTAGDAARDDWRALLAAPATPTELHARLAAYWTRIALCEHASVASFARFILQLLAVGAPADLVLGAQRALADEVEHARVCFALASLYQGTGVGPGPLPAATAVDAATDLESIVAAVIREACVGETLSALEVREAAARAVDPSLARALATIADDEQRHAELGWRFVRWALPRLDADARARVDASFNAAIDEAARTADALADRPGAPELRAHGVVDEPLRAALWAEGLRALVRPAAAALRAAA